MSAGSSVPVLRRPPRLPGPWERRSRRLGRLAGLGRISQPRNPTDVPCSHLTLLPLLPHWPLLPSALSWEHRPCHSLCQEMPLLSTGLPNDPTQNDIAPIPWPPLPNTLVIFLIYHHSAFCLTHYLLYYLFLPVRKILQNRNMCKFCMLWFLSTKTVPCTG